MTDENPYTPPEQKAAMARPTELASLMARFSGALIDSGIALVLMLPILDRTGILQKAAKSTTTYLDALFVGILSIVMFLILQTYLLSNYGQTIGKYFARTRIVSIHDDKILPFNHVFLLRYLPIQLIGLIPIVAPIFGIINVLYIFNANRRCVHDLIAGTKVIKA